MKSITTEARKVARRRSPRRPTRRVTDYLFRVSIPGKHHNLERAA